MTITKRQITPPNFTPAMGAYSHGLSVDVKNARMVFVTGQIALDSSGNVVSENIEEQTRFVFENIRKILNDAGAGFKDVVKAQIFLTDINDFAKVSPIRNEYFGESKPVSTLVGVSALVKPGCKVEIEVIAMTPSEESL
jgi:2-iminobutanoate/2-iminopropanoate deaminase